MLNHANDATTHYLIHRNLENEGKLKHSKVQKEASDSFELTAEDQYIEKKNKIDLSIF